MVRNWQGEYTAALLEFSVLTTQQSYQNVVNNRVNNNNNVEMTAAVSWICRTMAMPLGCRRWKTGEHITNGDCSVKDAADHGHEATKLHLADGCSSLSHRQCCAMSVTATTSTTHWTRQWLTRRRMDAALAATTSAEESFWVSRPRNGVWSARPRVSQSLYTYSIPPQCRLDHQAGETTGRNLSNKCKIWR